MTLLNKTIYEAPPTPPFALTQSSPLASLAASGKWLDKWIIKTLFFHFKYPRPRKELRTVFVPYYVAPDQKSPCQIYMRDSFSLAVQAWQNLPHATKKTFENMVAQTGACLSGYNLFLSLYLKNAAKSPICPCSHKPRPDHRKIKVDQGNS